MTLSRRTVLTGALALPGLAAPGWAANAPALRAAKVTAHQAHARPWLRAIPPDAPGSG